MSDYLKEEKKPLSLRLIMEEASRCLLCKDAPCSSSCPAYTDPARFIRAIRFKNLCGAVEVVRENNALASICARVCPTEKYCQSGCSRSGIDKPIDTTGAGDSFVAGFVLGLYNNLAIEDCIKQGNTFGRNACKYIGATDWINHL